WDTLAEPRRAQKQLFGEAGERVEPSCAACFCQERISRARNRWVYAVSPLSWDWTWFLSRGETVGAVLGAVGPRAWAGPSRPGMRRSHAPHAQGERLTDCAALRQAWVARWRCGIVRLLSPLPPARSGVGARPHQAHTGCSAGHWLLSVPLSARRVCA